MNATVAACVGAALAAGLALAFQAPINAQLGKVTQSTLLAATISFALSTALLIALSMGTKEFRLLSEIQPTRWWYWIGGVFGPIYMLGVIFAVPHIGVVSTFAAIVAGQLLGAMAFDLIGAFGVIPRPISVTRVIAVCFVFVGVVLSRF